MSVIDGHFGVEPVETCDAECDIEIDKRSEALEILREVCEDLNCVILLPKVLYEEQLLAPIIIRDICSLHHIIHIENSVDHQLSRIAFQISNCGLEYFHLGDLR